MNPWETKEGRQVWDTAAEYWTWLVDNNLKDNFTPFTETSSKTKNKIGYKKEKLTVIQLLGRLTYSSGSQLVWLCKCDCGTYVKQTSGNLTSKSETKSCGCLGKEKSSSRMKILNKLAVKHGLSSHPLYDRWYGIYKRCCVPNDKDYINYGQRGIMLCSDWMYPASYGFVNFLKDMEESYSEGMTIERLDNNKGYSKDNCAWKTIHEQCLNKRTNLNIPYAYPDKGTYKSTVQYNGCIYYLGNFKTKEEAFCAAIEFKRNNNIPVPININKIYEIINEATL